MDLKNEMRDMELQELKQGMAIHLARFLGYKPLNSSKFGPDPILSCNYLYARQWDWDEEKLAWTKDGKGNRDAEL